MQFGPALFYSIRMQQARTKAEAHTELLIAANDEQVPLEFHVILVGEFTKKWGTIDQ